MDIQIDTREKQRAIRKILKTFDDNGVKHFSSKLLVGDYMSLDNPRLIIDRNRSSCLGKHSGCVQVSRCSRYYTADSIRL